MPGLTVIQVARMSGVTADAVRYYARKGLLTPVRSVGNGYRQFAATDVQRLRFIKRAQSLGFSLREIAVIIDHSRQGKSPCPLVREIIERRAAQTSAELEELSRLRDRMERAMRRWRHLPDGVPTGDAICSLIEAIELDPASKDGAPSARAPLKRRVGRRNSVSRTR